MIEQTALTLVGSVGIATLALLGAASLASMICTGRRPEERRPAQTTTYRHR